LLGDSAWIGESGASNDLPITKAKLLPTAKKLALFSSRP